MTQYTIKPLEWHCILNHHTCITDAWKFIIEENQPVTLKAIYTGRNHEVEKHYRFGVLSMAINKAQEIWNDYLKQYLEVAK